MATYLNVPPGDLTVLPVSPTEAWAARLAGDEARLDASGLPGLEQRIWTTLVRQAVARRLRGAVDALLRRLAEAIAPVASELTALAGPAELEQVLAELDEDGRRAVDAGRTLAGEGAHPDRATGSSGRCCDDEGKFAACVPISFGPRADLYLQKVNRRRATS